MAQFFILSTHQQILTMQNQRKKVGIIGSGPAGLVSAKYALEYGFLPEVFQKSTDVGGVWHPETGAVWKEMTTNVTNYSMYFTGHPWPEGTPLHPTSRMVQEYFISYAERNQILEHISFNSEVISVERKLKQNKFFYMVTVRKEGKITLHEYEYLVAASGIFSVPHIPDIAGLKNFKGNYIHSRYYRSGQSYKGKRVLVIGGSYTGIELASNISKYAKTTYHSFKYPFWVLPHFTQSQGLRIPSDFYETRLCYLKPNEHAAQNSNLFYLKNCYEQLEIPELRIEEKQFDKIGYRTISTDYIKQCKAGKITPIKSIVERISENSVVLTALNQNDKELEYQIDEIILCTGYKAGVDYFSKEIQEILDYKEDDRLKAIVLYKEMYHPKLENLFFVGIQKNPFFSVIELQAQFALRKIAGKISLPSDQQLKKGLEQDRAIRQNPNRGQFPHLFVTKFADEIAKAAGNDIDIPKLLKDPTDPLYAAYFKMPIFPCVKNSFTTINIEEQIKQSARIVEAVTGKVKPVGPL